MSLVYVQVTMYRRLNVSSMCTGNYMYVQTSNLINILLKNNLKPKPSEKV